MGKMHGGLNVLLVCLGVRNDQICRHLVDICPSTDEMLHGPLKFMGIDFPTGVALPDIRAALKAEIKRLKPCLHHQSRNVLRDKPSIERIWRMKVHFRPTLQDLAQEGHEDLLGLEQQGIIIKRDMLCPALAEPGKLRQRAVERTRRKWRIDLWHRTVSALEGTAVSEF